ncbi:esterase [Rheinheimera sp. SA_1]|uniref:alpha/beta hydrolase n=1 Tax=Rheinheimera sp. SA_1 TaxID=1827365 RepID=UPI0008015AA9|nr:alpha/beta hydrolase [Rheinheimera sp. SA_1]OBP13755.1 esterase [Rheinheimera sp. SA_1]
MNNKGKNWLRSAAAVLTSWQRVRQSIILAFCIFTAQAMAQANDQMTPIAIPKQTQAIELGTPPLPTPESGVLTQESWHTQYGSRFARNVTIATLTPFLPEPGKASGAAVIVAPGGGFRTLSMDNEGWDVARALAKQGIAAFVLKYRLTQTPADMADFQRSMAQMFSRRPPRPDPAQMLVQLAPQLEDAHAAFALVRSRASEWQIDPDRIGMIGFSAGAMLTMATTLVGKDAKPAFIANIYGPLDAVAVPADAPPLFVALAADDPLFALGKFGLIESWHAAKKPVEFHFYEQGGHGFGMYPKETTSTGWFNAYSSWLKMHGMHKPKA